MLRNFNAMKAGPAAEKVKEVGRKLRERSEQIEALLEKGKDVPEELLSMVEPPTAPPAGQARTVAELEQSQEQRREELRLQDYPEPTWSSRPTTRLPSGKGKGGSKGNYGGKGGKAKGKGGRGWVTWKGQLEEYGGGAEGAAVART